jgi:hypothetical protein
VGGLPKHHQGVAVSEDLQLHEQFQRLDELLDGNCVSEFLSENLEDEQS